MTILTKSTDKKKLLPIATPLPINHARSPSEAESATIHQAREKTTTCLVCLMACLVLLAGVLAGFCFYRQYLQERVHRFNGFIPYDRDVDIAENSFVNQYWRDDRPAFYNNQDENDSSDANAEMDQRLQSLLNELFANMKKELGNPLKDIRTMESEIQSLDDKSVREKFFREEITVQDDEDDSYADIKIPDFRDGRRGRFIHDYKNNQTTIIDEDYKRCFVYPLDYETTMPPKSIIDVFAKMQTGYYFPDTTTLNKKMRVVLPMLDIQDDYISGRTRSVCSDKRIYRMEPIVSGVYKRSISEALEDQSKFAEFAGIIVKYDITNMSEVEAYEQDIKN